MGKKRENYPLRNISSGYDPSNIVERAGITFLPCSTSRYPKRKRWADLILGLSDDENLFLPELIQPSDKAAEDALYETESIRGFCLGSACIDPFPMRAALDDFVRLRHNLIKQKIWA